ncbi:MAG: hypothetical protein PHD51_00115 [Patescibacteria group bacterium]|nr:hypothetical protein [Patescibacteria group bacterium]MDD5490727.1 hypothetical protein [Patescibacteria group bacterium]
MGYFLRKIKSGELEIPLLGKVRIFQAVISHAEEHMGTLFIPTYDKSPSGASKTATRQALRFVDENISEEFISGISVTVVESKNLFEAPN